MNLPRERLYQNIPQSVSYNAPGGQILDLTYDCFGQSGVMFGSDEMRRAIREAELVIADNQKLAQLASREGRRVYTVRYGEMDIPIHTSTPIWHIGLLAHSYTAFCNLVSYKNLTRWLIDEWNAILYVDRDLRGEVVKVFGEERLEEDFKTFVGKIDLLALPSPTNALNDLCVPLSIMRCQTSVIASSSSSYREIGQKAGYSLLDSNMRNWFTLLSQYQSLPALLEKSKVAARKHADQINSENRSKLEMIVARHFTHHKETI